MSFNESLKEIISSIHEDKIDMIEDILRSIEFNNVKPQLIFNLINMLLGHAYNIDNKDAGTTILNYFAETNPSEPIYPTVVSLYFIQSTNIKVLKWVLDLYERNIFDDILHFPFYEQEPTFELALSRLDEIHGEQDEEFYNNVLAYLKEEGIQNPLTSGYIIRKIEELSKPAPPPAWIIEEDNPKYSQFKDNIPTQKYLESITREEPEVDKFIIPSGPEAADLLTKGLENQGLTVEDIKDQREHIARQYELSDTETKIELIKPFYTIENKKLLENDDSIFRIYGPSNRIDGEYLMLQNTPCSRLGGCRMFLCLHLENYSEDLGVQDSIPDFLDWFHPECDYCERKILKRNYAFRLPGLFGGWKGCFCSVDCTKGSIERDDYNIVYMSLIDIAVENLRKTGIQERIYGE
jgi:hypothetical protein